MGHLHGEPPTPAGSPVVDPAVLDGLIGRLGGRGAALRAGLLQTWREESRTRLEELAAAVAADDREGVARVAHTLMPGSAALGAGPLAALCEQVESELRAGRPVDLAAIARDLTEHVAQTDAAFTRLWPG